MFEPMDALEEFRKFLAARGLSESTLGVHDGFEAMFDFYRSVRPARCSSGQADMLLFQWGTYDWGRGEHFGLDLTRQLIIDGPEGEPSEDEDYWQLHLTFHAYPV